MAETTSEQVNSKYRGLSQKGKTNNPGGRPKMPDKVKEMLRANTVKAVETLIELMHNAKREETRKACADTILDRVLGKAAQPIVGDNEHDPITIDILDPEKRRQLIDAYIRRSPTD